MKRDGKTLKDLGDGAPRRLPDARNAWRKMDDTQRRTFLRWVFSDEGPTLPNEGAVADLVNAVRAVFAEAEESFETISTDDVTDKLVDEIKRTADALARFDFWECS